MNKKDFVINCLYIVCWAGIVYLAGKYLLPIMVPFIIGFFVALLVRKIVKISNRDKKQRTVIISLVIFYSIFGLLCVLLGIVLFNSIKNVDYVSFYTNSIEPSVNSLYAAITDLNKKLPSNMSGILNQAIQTLFDGFKSLVLSVSSYLISLITSFITSIPDLIIDVTIIIVSSFYMCVDYEKIFGKIYSVVPQKVKDVWDDLVFFVKNNIAKIMKSYGLIMLITFLELTIGFIILRVNNFILLAALVAIMDIFPIVGVGTVLIPWGIVDIVIGRFWRGLLVLVIYTVITVIRNIIEPKMVGGDLGLHPMVSLVAMIIGLGLFGLFGMLGLPLLCAFLMFRQEKNKEPQPEIEVQ